MRKVTAHKKHQRNIKEYILKRDVVTFFGARCGTVHLYWCAVDYRVIVLGTTHGYVAVATF